MLTMAAILCRSCIHIRIVVKKSISTLTPVRQLSVSLKNSFTPICFRTRLVCDRSPLYKFAILLQGRNIPIRRLHLGRCLKDQFEINSNVAKDVIMFKHDNNNFFKILNAFAITQFLFWSYLSVFCFTKMRDAPVQKEKNEDQPWWRSINLGENKYKNTLSALCFIIGYGILAGSWLFTLKSVRYLVLRKGGKEVTFVTYGPFGRNRMMTVGLENISCEESRKSAKVQLPIKVKGHYLYYMLDMRGQFTNARLFDATAGLKRVWKN